MKDDAKSKHNEGNNIHKNTDFEKKTAKRSRPPGAESIRGKRDTPETTKRTITCLVVLPIVVPPHFIWRTAIEHIHEDVPQEVWPLTKPPKTNWNSIHMLYLMLTIGIARHAA